MGIKNLNAFFKDNLPDLKLKKQISELRGKKIAIDGTLLLCKHLSIEMKILLESLKNPIDDDLNEDDVVANILRKFLLRERNFIEKGFVTYWFFDGKSPEEKKSTQETRIKSRDAMKKKFENLKKEYLEMDEDDLDFSRDTKFASLVELRSTTLQLNRKSMSEKLLKKMKELGIAAGIARGEGEQHCASYCASGLADYVFTTDTDVLAMGQSIITSFEKNHVEVYDYAEIIDQMSLDKDQFRDFCILLGCDFNKKLMRVNAFDTFCLISDHKKIENIPKAVAQKDLKFEECRKLLGVYEIQEDEFLDCDENRKDNIDMFLFGKTFSKND